MTIVVPKSVVRAIEDHAREAYPEECCGFLLGHGSDPRTVEEARRARNVAPEDRARRYVIDPLENLHADDVAGRKGLELIGIYHSHPDHPAAPSEFDRSRATSWYTYLILSIVDRTPKELTAWRFVETANVFRPEELAYR